METGSGLLQLPELKVYLQYCECCMFCFVIQPLSEPDKQDRLLDSLFKDYKKINFIWLPNLIFPKGLIHDFNLVNSLKYLYVSFFVKMV